MSVLIVGTVAYDTIETPTEKAERILGGSATFASFASSTFAPTAVCAVIGEDFRPEHMAKFAARGIDTRGIERKPGKCFFWAGRYEKDPNIRHTLATELNVLAEFSPVIPDDIKKSRFLFLANVDPEIQLKTLDLCPGAEFTLADTMNFWIDGKRDALDEVLRRVDCALLNDEEARMLSGASNLIEAAEKILAAGPRAVIIKKGEHGAALFTADDYFCLPAYPLKRVKDPTGAGDTFAGGLIGSVARDGHADSASIRCGMTAGAVLASFCVEDFSTAGLEQANPAGVRQRAEFIRKAAAIETINI